MGREPEGPNLRKIVGHRDNLETGVPETSDTEEEGGGRCPVHFGTPKIPGLRCPGILDPGETLQRLGLDTKFPWKAAVSRKAYQPRPSRSRV